MLSEKQYISKMQLFASKIINKSASSFTDTDLNNTSFDGENLPNGCSLINFIGNINSGDLFLKIIDCHPHYLKTFDFNKNVSEKCLDQGVSLGWTLARFQLLGKIFSLYPELMQSIDLNIKASSDQHPDYGVSVGLFLALQEPEILHIIFTAFPEQMLTIDLNSYCRRVDPPHTFTLGWMIAKYDGNLIEKVLKCNSLHLKNLKINMEPFEQAHPHKNITFASLLIDSVKTYLLIKILLESGQKIPVRDIQVLQILFSSFTSLEQLCEIMKNYSTEEISSLAATSKTMESVHIFNLCNIEIEISILHENTNDPEKYVSLNEMIKLILELSIQAVEHFMYCNEGKFRELLTLKIVQIMTTNKKIYESYPNEYTKELTLIDSKKLLINSNLGISNFNSPLDLPITCQFEYEIICYLRKTEILFAEFSNHVVESLKSSKLIKANHTEKPLKSSSSLDSSGENANFENGNCIGSDSPKTTLLFYEEENNKKQVHKMDKIGGAGCTIA